ncbi:IS5 family transposase [Massilia sp. BSC265]|uniref:IS5 family transposase n=1 Tax=Massilia sp. BSC265 TaxID=1549812 RepID=UPI0009DC976B|nr:IS5 family transposase [Massilia sp. BSC265]
MVRALLPEDLWSLIAAHLPAHHRSPKGGRPRIDDRAALTGILFVLKTGIPWEYLPRELGCGSGMTCWRRLHEWMLAGVWQRSIHEAILRRLREHDQIMWDRACVDAASVPAPAGGEHTGRNPTDRGKLGSKHHLLVDERGLPLVAQISGAQVHDSRFLIPLIELIPAVKGLAGRARKRPGKLHADRAYASRAHRAWLRSRGIAARIARYGVESRERLGRWCWVVERTLGWLHRFRRLRIRLERRADVHQAFLSLACSLICWRYVERFC